VGKGKKYSFEHAGLVEPPHVSLIFKFLLTWLFAKRESDRRSQNIKFSLINFACNCNLQPNVTEFWIDYHFRLIKHPQTLYSFITLNTLEM